MITKDINAIVFNILKYKDNDIIVDLLTYEYGFIQVYVKGAQKMSSKSFYIFQVFNIISIDLSKINLNELSIYRSGSIIETFDYTKLNYQKINVSMLISELLVKIKDIKDLNQKKYYLMIKQAVRDLLNENKQILFTLNHLLLETLEILGCKPHLDSCSVCNIKKQIKGYSKNSNGFICCDCHLENDELITNKPALEYLYNLNNNLDCNKDNNSMDIMVFEMLYRILVESSGIYLVSKDYILGG